VKPAQSAKSAKSANRVYQSVWHDRAYAPPVAAYLHIPFCRRRCFYCDFPISVIGDRRDGSNSLGVQTYVDQLCREIAATPNQGRSLETIFFGGGTPSLLTAAQIVRLLEALDRQFGIAATAEISIELDPGTFDRAKLETIAAAGVNRVSIGVQTFEDRLLQAIGRSHTADEIDQAIALLQSGLIENFSLDLMAGLPYQTAEDWDRTLDRAIAIAPPHLSYYDLIVEPGTVFDRYYQPGAAPLPTEAAAAEMYRRAADRLTAAGYDHYEISNYAQPGYACRHNLTYWQNETYYGLGLGATSYVNGQRVARPRRRDAYADWLDRYVARGGVVDTEPVTAIDLALESVMLGLRTATGIDRDLWRSELRQLAGDTAIARVDRLVAQYEQAGAITIKTDSNRLRLTDPEGFLMSNSVLSDLFNAIEGDES
jgi:oxygen-independent coproporphyrinogen-3 oxidase